MIILLTILKQILWELNNLNSLNQLLALKILIITFLNEVSNNVED